jgi:hypothetical protein
LREAQRRGRERRKPAVIRDTVLADLKHDRQAGSIGGGHERLGVFQQDDVERTDGDSSPCGRAEQICPGRKRHGRTQTSCPYRTWR